MRQSLQIESFSRSQSLHTFFSKIEKSLLGPILALLLVSLTYSASSFAQSSSSSQKQLGLGIILLSPTGFSANYFLNKGLSVDAALSWSLNDNDQNLYVHSTLLWHKPKLIRIDKTGIDVYFGAGGRIISWEDPPGKDRDSETRLGLRAPAGVKYQFQNPPIEIFSELSLTMEIIPETDADLGFGIGARFYF